MKRIPLKTPFSLLALFILLACSACNQKQSQIIESEPEIKNSEYIPAGYNMVWSDEFNDNPNQDGALSLPGKDWTFETGNHGWGNDEPQNYVDKLVGNDTVAKVKDGSLIITAFKLTEPYEGSEYISARMNTTHSWKYGYFEMRAKMPKGRGTWAAFWMLPEKFENWPIDGEIDIMEYVGYKPNVTHSTVHTAAYNHKDKTEKSGEVTITNADSEFHIYALEWTEDEISGYVDGAKYFSFTNDHKGDKTTWPFDEPFYIKLNLAIGGGWGGVEGIDPDIFPARYEIDYVRVYQK